MSQHEPKPASEETAGPDEPTVAFEVADVLRAQQPPEQPERPPLRRRY